MHSLPLLPPLLVQTQLLRILFRHLPVIQLDHSRFHGHCRRRLRQRQHRIRPAPPLRQRLAGRTSIAEDAYDWALNNAPAGT